MKPSVRITAHGRILFSAFLVFSASSVHPADCIVTNTSDTGPGSLREAIASANANPGPDAILFHISKTDPNYNPQTGVWTIRPASSFSTISDSNLIINGSSQRAFIGQDTNPVGPEIELDGSSTQSANGFFVKASGVEIVHLIINRFGSMGIYLSSAGRCRIAGCYIGTNPSGTAQAGNLFGVFMDGGSHHNMIVPLDTLPSIISGNPWGGIKIGFASTDNVVMGNTIGLNRTRTDTISNGLRGGYGGVYLSD